MKLHSLCLTKIIKLIFQLPTIAEIEKKQHDIKEAMNHKFKDSEIDTVSVIRGLYDTLRRKSQTYK